MSIQREALDGQLRFHLDSSREDLSMNEKGPGLAGASCPLDFTAMSEGVEGLGRSVSRYGLGGVAPKVFLDALLPTPYLPPSVKTLTARKHQE
eukprot:gene10451-biopygen224